MLHVFRRAADGNGRVHHMYGYHDIFFDLDGTLTDPGLGITNSVMHALRHYGITVTDRRELYPYIGPPLMESFQEFCGFSETRARWLRLLPGVFHRPGHL
jgi:phosphoglycolate phosphatase